MDDVKIKIFDYIPVLDCFVTNRMYNEIATNLGIQEWNPVVWIGRYFSLDNDFGEHWFDNWDERNALEKKAEELGYTSDNLLIVMPNRFQNSQDGPCHPPELRKKFWTDVLKSLELSLDMLCEEARYIYKKYGNHLPDLEKRVQEVKVKYNNL